MARAARRGDGVLADGIDVEDLKELFRSLPNEVRDETVEGVREYRKGARRPVSAHAGKSLARAMHTARRARRRPDSDEEVSAAIGQALAAEMIASLDVEIAAEVILPKRDLLDRESRNARRKARDDETRTRDERRRALARRRPRAAIRPSARTAARRSAASTSSRSSSSRTRSRARRRGASFFRKAEET